MTWLTSNVPSFAVVDYRLKDCTSEKLIARLLEFEVPTLIYSGNDYFKEFDHPIMSSLRWLPKPVGPHQLRRKIPTLIASND